MRSFAKILLEYFPHSGRFFSGQQNLRALLLCVCYYVNKKTQDHDRNLKNSMKNNSMVEKKRLRFTKNSRWVS